MKITVDIESLIRDSEKIRIIESLIEAEGGICESTLSAVLGRCIPEKSSTELPFVDVPEKDGPCREQCEYNH